MKVLKYVVCVCVEDDVDNGAFEEEFFNSEVDTWPLDYTIDLVKESSVPSVDPNINGDEDTLEQDIDNWNALASVQLEKIQP